MDSRFAPLAIVLALLTLLTLLVVLPMASEAIFSFLFFNPLASAIAVWSLIGLVGGGALVYYAFIEPRRKPTQQAPDVETESSPD